MKRTAMAVFLFLLMALSAWGQQTTSSTIKVTQNHTPTAFQNSLQGATSLTISYVFSGSPSTFTGVLQGISSGGVATTLDTYSNITNGTDSVTLGATYSYFQLVPSWTGGKNVAVTATLDMTGPGPPPVIPTVLVSSLTCDGSLLTCSPGTGAVTLELGSNPHIPGSVFLPSGTQSIGTVSFSGSGLNDMTNGGAYTCLGSDEFSISILSTGTPDTFSWNDNNAAGTGVQITGTPQLLSCGVSIIFAATTGHTTGDSWTFTSTGTQIVAPIVAYSLASSTPALTVNADGSLIGLDIFTDNPSLSTNSVSLGQGAMGQGAGSVEGDTAVGAFALFADIGGSNTAFGSDALSGVTDGQNNVAIGIYAGASEVSGSNNIFVGSNAGAAETGSNMLYIDNDQMDVPFIVGNMSSGVLSLAINSSLSLNAAGDVNSNEMLSVFGDAAGDIALNVVSNGSQGGAAAVITSNGSSSTQRGLALITNSNYDDSAGSATGPYGIAEYVTLSGSNVANDEAVGLGIDVSDTGTGNTAFIGGIVASIDNTSTGTVGEIAGVVVQDISLGTYTIAAAFADEAGWPADIVIDTTATVASLPPAATYVGAFKGVKNSTAIVTEGQTCVDAGGGGAPALAFSNGTIWKCF